MQKSFRENWESFKVTDRNAKDSRISFRERAKWPEYNKNATYPFSGLFIAPDQLQSLLDRPRDDRSCFGLHDRPLDQVRVRDHRGDDFLVRRLIRKPGSRATACQLYGPKPRFSDQLFQHLGRKRLVEIIHLLVINAVFTKQRRQIAAGRSGGFFVDGYSVLHR